MGMNNRGKITIDAVSLRTASYRTSIRYLPCPSHPLENSLTIPHVSGNLKTLR